MHLVFFTIILTHYFADFIMQDEKWALGKSKNMLDLTLHVSVYSLCWFIPAGFILSYNAVWFVLITFVCHWLTDYFTSKAVSKKFAKNEYGSSIPNFGAFSYIGFDQVLHYTQLYLTYIYLS